MVLFFHLIRSVSCFVLVITIPSFVERNTLLKVHLSLIEATGTDIECLLIANSKISWVVWNKTALHSFCVIRTSGKCLSVITDSTV